jgi:hypothetical protein
MQGESWGFHKVTLILRVWKNEHLSIVDVLLIGKKGPDS